jgi:hypothetical protein
MLDTNIRGLRVRDRMVVGFKKSSYLIYFIYVLASIGLGLSLMVFNFQQYFSHIVALSCSYIVIKILNLNSWKSNLEEIYYNYMKL